MSVVNGDGQIDWCRRGSGCHAYGSREQPTTATTHDSRRHLWIVSPDMECRSRIPDICLTPRHVGDMSATPPAKANILDYHEDGIVLCTIPHHQNGLKDRSPPGYLSYNNDNNDNDAGILRT